MEAVSKVKRMELVCTCGWRIRFSMEKSATIITTSRSHYFMLWLLVTVLRDTPRVLANNEWAETRFFFHESEAVHCGWLVGCRLPRSVLGGICRNFQSGQHEPHSTTFSLLSRTEIFEMVKLFIEYSVVLFLSNFLIYFLSTSSISFNFVLHIFTLDLNALKTWTMNKSQNP